MKKIAVLGTCFSRNMFNSDVYFNPDYRKDAVCVLNQYHTSILSIIRPPFSWNISGYTDIFEAHKQFVMLDFSKAFFKKIKSEEVDYLIIDLYSDAIKETAFLEGGSGITLSPMIENSILLKDLPITRVTDHNLINVFYKEWDDAILIFRKKLLKTIDEKNIILNAIQFTTEYYNKAGKICSFETLNQVKQNNQRLDYLNQSFKKVFPKAKIIDLTNKGYIGDSKYPFGLSVSHYESRYYKEMFQQLLEIVR